MSSVRDPAKKFAATTPGAPNSTGVLVEVVENQIVPLAAIAVTMAPIMTQALVSLFLLICFLPFLFESFWGFDLAFLVSASASMPNSHKAER
jgi:hypothetical protein